MANGEQLVFGRRGRPPKASVVAIMAGLAFAVGAGCDPSEPGDPAPEPPKAAVVLSFDDLQLPHGSPQPSFANEGSADVDVSVVATDGGVLRGSPGRTGSSDLALRTPDFDPTRPAPRAVLALTGASSGDPLDPGTRPFTFGASFVLDDPSTSSIDGSIDDGDNLLQRGLYEEVSQFKLELDAARPLCRVKGRSGDLSVVGTAVEPGRWYRVECTRTAERVTMTLTDLETERVQRWVRDGETGSMTPAAATVPLSVGGKVRDGAIDWNTDQFNGVIDDVVVDIG